MKKIILYFLAVSLIVGIVRAAPCNAACLETGYSYGICTDSCQNTEIIGADDCSRSGQAVVVIGSDAVRSYKTLDPFIDEKEEDPNWIWIIKNMKTKARTTILDTSDDAQHTGPILGIKNDFIATDIDETDIKAKKVGESFCFPGDIACIKFIGLTVSDYGTYTMQKTTVDLSAFNTSWSNKAAILINSVDDADGLKLDTAGYDDPVSSASGATTDKIWVVYNSSGSYAGVFYEDANNVKKLAGFLNMNLVTDDINIADINYKNTQNTDIQLDLRGHFGTPDNLDLVLDILGFEGAAATDGSDDIRINLKHANNSDFTGYGNTSASADDADLVWVSTNIGTKDEDHRSLYGIVIKDPKTNNAADKAEFEIPSDQVKAKIEISRDQSEITKIKKSTTTVLGEIIPPPVLASELKRKEDQHLIFVGGPCANSVVEEFKEFPTCLDWPLKPGEAMIKYTNNGNNIAFLVAGTTAEDTKMAAEFLADFGKYENLEGTYIKLVNKEPEAISPISSGIDFSDYPYPFIKDGLFQNMLLVVGDKAKAQDTIGAVDIAGSLMSITRTSTEAVNTTELVTGSTNITDEIPLGNNLADTNFFSASISSGDIGSLIDYKTTFGSNDIDYHEALMLYNTGPSIETSLSSTDDLYKSDVYMEATAGSIRYYFAFDDEIDISTATVNSPLTINMLDNELSITSTTSATEFKSQTANKYFMNAGDKVTVEDIDVELEDIAKDGSILVVVNGTSEIINDDQNKYLAGLNVKNLEAFDETGATCCCTDLLNF